jgi:sn-glycerol 3-phosphate transport system ATP-binding protein
MADISIKGVRKSYGKTEVVHGVDLEIAHGEFVVILGPSGCGKSTLLRMIAGLEGISGGTIAIAGTTVNDLEPRQRGCAMVFQNYALYPHMTVGENIGYALKVAGVSKSERRQRVATVAKSIGLEDFLDRKPGQLSGGQRQRVAMGRAMIREPKVFLFDEPLSNLDAKLRGQMRLEIRKLHARLATTSVFVTHDQVEAMTLADRIVIMNAGRIEQIGTPEEIYRVPKSLFVAGFIGSPPMNLLPATVADGVVVASSVTLAPAERFGVAPGSAVTIGIRPEDAVIRPDGRYAFVPEFAETLGSVKLLHGTFAGLEFVLQCAASEAFAAKEEVRFDLPVESMHAFNNANGARL